MAGLNVKRVERDIEKYIPMIIQRECKDELLKSITITDCRLTHDYSYCKVFFTSLLDMDKSTLEKEVNEAAGFIRKKLADVLDVRSMPQLHFSYDTSEEYAKNIDEIIDKIHQEGN